jgi:hypothetical protein
LGYCSIICHTRESSRPCSCAVIPTQDSHSTLLSVLRSWELLVSLSVSLPSRCGKPGSSCLPVTMPSMMYVLGALSVQDLNPQPLPQVACRCCHPRTCLPPTFSNWHVAPSHAINSLTITLLHMHRSPTSHKPATPLSTPLSSRSKPFPVQSRCQSELTQSILLVWQNGLAILPTEPNPIITLGILLYHFMWRVVVFPSSVVVLGYRLHDRPS